jgi:hydroxybutyrate-dimer hydrolase
VVTEPNLAPDSAGKFVIRFDDADFAGHGDSLYGAITLMSLYAPCAALDGSLAGSPLFGLEPLTTPAIGFPARANRCASLHDSGLLSATALADQAKEALDRIRAYGYLEEAVRLLASHEWLSLWRSLQATYAPAYGGFGFSQRHCGTSFAATDTTGLPKPVPVETAERLFATSSGIPATDGINVIADNAQGGPIHENLARSASSGRQDLNADGARCFRYLATGDGNLLPNPPSPAEIVRHEAVIAGLEAIKMTGDLGGRPAIIIHGRSDALVFPNQHSRPYFGLNQIVEGGSSRLSYVEVTDAQHFDTFISGLLRNPVTLAVEYAPLHFYLTEGLELMLAHLRDPSQPLPASQVVRPTPRGAAAYEAGNVAALLPDIPITPAPADAISFAGGVLNIPK